MSDTIVIGTDGSETAKRALAEGIRIAKALDAKVHVVSAYSPMRARVAGREGSPEVRNPLPDDHVTAVLEQAEAAVRLAGVSVTPHSLRSAPDDALIQVADEVGATMIVVGSRGMHGARRALGSVPNTVAHRAHCSVLIVDTAEVHPSDPE